jgi:hypothetical protein
MGKTEMVLYSLSAHYKQPPGRTGKCTGLSNIMERFWQTFYASHRPYWVRIPLAQWALTPKKEQEAIRCRLNRGRVSRFAFCPFSGAFPANRIVCSETGSCSAFPRICCNGGSLVSSQTWFAVEVPLPSLPLTINGSNTLLDGVRLFVFRDFAILCFAVDRVNTLPIGGRSARFLLFPPLKLFCDTFPRSWTPAHYSDPRHTDCRAGRTAV